MPRNVMIIRTLFAMPFKAGAAPRHGGGIGISASIRHKLCLGENIWARSTPPTVALPAGNTRWEQGGVTTVMLPPLRRVPCRTSELSSGERRGGMRGRMEHAIAFADY